MRLFVDFSTTVSASRLLCSRPLLQLIIHDDDELFSHYLPFLYDFQAWRNKVIIDIWNPICFDKLFWLSWNSKKTKIISFLKRANAFRAHALERTPWERTLFKCTPLEHTPLERTPWKGTPLKRTPFMRTPFDQHAFWSHAFIAHALRAHTLERTPFEGTP